MILAVAVLLALAPPTTGQSSSSQLVDNSSFEDYVGCPQMIFEINLTFATGWMTANLTTCDLCVADPCASSDFQTPNNWVGAQQPHEGSVHGGFLPLPHW